MTPELAAIIERLESHVKELKSLPGNEVFLGEIKDVVLSALSDLTAAVIELAKREP